ncbi:TPA: hypothetical protein OXL58_002927 [Acinetobacter baumannii]|uniref:CDI toxin immunity protein n=1 Tax=Acinetobacter baumannii TaxID=470 RepID=UPI000DE5EE86|nr:hypothetical protein [Acinetobacter baumannii]MCZ3129325.1 hypothetical protein [Acinetobacter baumannii]MDC4839341.1 hypothetical protein [Acinetobacter baumannii]SSI16908.1 Uncharacterised protein [Acinetobacter baumannii]SSO08175.1 Uncharacterised protein [Acinetobacter baumannii]SSO42502.1 Uncharacterised protein [Acinetobacter baumannii]
MSLFEECKNALKNDFQIISGIDVEDVYTKLNMYPIKQNCILWTDMNFNDFDNMDELLESMQTIHNENVYVVADDQNIPVFTSKLKSIIENIYDVMALCPKVFIFNETILLEPLFPTYTVRVAFKSNLNKSYI